ncbi:two-component system sensor histidine kinase DesK [Tahibacter aquaticus]|uniref:Two-component system sensor histidine kinase DesK n=1 Tax=Tahibacter aquaticus TaxID=520092 RepID=A0A4R6YYH1_9GAMM|nr:sensor histidine kinase [Tahibacter aquaticus]TDR44069.1 two-component system sensor histidine kinase DesK [Tahibacter aquaticus]
MISLNHPRLLAWRDRLVPAELDMGWGSFISLGYMAFLFLPLLMPRIASAQWLMPTLAAAALFLPLYFRAYWAKGRELVLLLLAMWALGCALVQVNPFANTLVIYACAFAPHLGSLRTSLLFALAMTASFSFYLIGFDRGAPLTIGITYLVGAACFVGSYFMRENQRKQVALRLSHEEVRRLAALAERERIGRDLHDLLGHTLSLIALKSELANRLWERDPLAARQEVREVERVARDALAQVRRAVTGIRSAGLAAEMASARLMLETDGTAFHYELERVALPPELETCLALVVREAVTNIQRHARATRASVRLQQDGDQVLVEVQDNGRGGDIVPGNGLTGMRERVRACGAELRVDAVRGEGTRLTVRVPLPRSGGLAADALRTH